MIQQVCVAIIFSIVLERCSVPDSAETPAISSISYYSSVPPSRCRSSIFIKLRALPCKIFQLIFYRTSRLYICLMRAREIQAAAMALALLLTITWVDIETDCWMDDRGSITGTDRIFLFSTTSRPPLQPIQPHIQLVLRAISQGLKRQERETDHSPSVSAKVKNGGTIPQLPPYISVA
jgi:hypothetical protein